MKRKLIVALIIAILCTLGTMVAAQEPDPLPKSDRPSCADYEGYNKGYGVAFQEVTLKEVVLKACKPGPTGVGYTVQLGVGPNSYWCWQWMSKVVTSTNFTTLTIPFEWIDTWRPPEMRDVACMYWSLQDPEPPQPPELPLNYSGYSSWWFHYRTYLPMISKEEKE